VTFLIIVFNCFTSLMLLGLIRVLIHTFVGKCMVNSQPFSVLFHFALINTLFG
jgi:hypothetical protein